MYGAIIVVCFIAFMLAIGIAIFFAVKWYEEKRTAQWQELADGLGFEFLGDSADFDDYGEFHLFKRGPVAAVKNAIRGNSAGIKILLADIKIDLPGDNDFFATVLFAENEALDLPAVLVRRRIPWVDKIGKFLESSGMADSIRKRVGEVLASDNVDVSEFEAFSSSFIVHSYDEEQAADVKMLISQPVCDILCENCASNQNMQFQLEGCGNKFLITNGMRIKPQDAEGYLQTAFTVMQSFSG